MNCRHAEELIQQGVDGTLTLSERAGLDTHLAWCAGCQAAWDEHQKLARLARHWVPQAGQMADGGDVFTAQVLARIAAQPAHAPANSVFWLPMAAALLLLALLPLFRHLLPTGLPDVWSAFPDITGWLLVNGRALPAEAQSLWAAIPSGQWMPNWIWGALLAAGAVNAVCYARATQSRERSLR